MVRSKQVSTRLNDRSLIIHKVSVVNLQFFVGISLADLGHEIVELVIYYDNR